MVYADRMPRAEDATLTPAERRERRRERILAGSERRINAILRGPDGTECRGAPAIEGGEGFTLNGFNSGTQCMGNGKVVDFPERSPSLEELGITYVPPKWFDFLRVDRVYASFFIGIVMRFFVAFSLLTNVVWPWTIAYTIYELLVASRSTAKYPQLSFLLSGLQYCGGNETFIIYAGFFFGGVRRYVRDSMVAAFAFLLTNAVFHVLHLAVHLISS